MIDLEALKALADRLRLDSLCVYSAEGPDRSPFGKGGELYSLCVEAPADKSAHRCVAYARGETADEARENGRALVELVKAVPELIAEIEKLRSREVPKSPALNRGALDPETYCKVSVAMAELMASIPADDVAYSLAAIAQAARRGPLGEEALAVYENVCHRMSIFGDGPRTPQHEYAAALEAVIAVRRGDDQARLHLQSFPTLYCFARDAKHQPQSESGRKEAHRVQESICELVPEARPLFEGARQG